MEENPTSASAFPFEQRRAATRVRVSSIRTPGISGAPGNVPGRILVDGDSCAPRGAAGLCSAMASTRRTVPVAETIEQNGMSMIATCASGYLKVDERRAGHRCPVRSRPQAKLRLAVQPRWRSRRRRRCGRCAGLAVAVSAPGARAWHPRQRPRRIVVTSGRVAKTDRWTAPASPR